MIVGGADQVMLKGRKGSITCSSLLSRDYIYFHDQGQGVILRIEG